LKHHREIVTLRLRGFARCDVRRRGPAF